MNDEYYVIPEEVTAIADGAFAGNKSLKHIDLRNVERIGEFAFQDCTNLETVIMSNVSVIGSGAFEFCRSLRSVTFGGIAEIGELAFFHCDKLDISEIPHSLRKAGAGAFSHTGLKHADLHWFEEIPSSLFSYCTSMEYADVSGAKVINDDAFASGLVMKQKRAMNRYFVTAIVFVIQVKGIYLPVEQVNQLKLHLSLEGVNTKNNILKGWCKYALTLAQRRRLTTLMSVFSTSRK